MLVPFPCRERVEPLPTSDEREAESQDGELDRLLFTKGDDERQESGVGGEEGEDEGFLVGGCGGGGRFFWKGSREEEVGDEGKQDVEVELCSIPFFLPSTRPPRRTRKAH